VAERLAQSRATALVRSEKGWAAISAMGDALYKCGRIEGKDIEAMCTAAYGRQMSPFQSWMLHWPPTLEMLRNDTFSGKAS